jgi:hypothetical protein
VVRMRLGPLFVNLSSQSFINTNAIYSWSRNQGP